MPGSNRKAEINAVQAVDIIDDHTVKFVLSASLRAAARGAERPCRHDGVAESGRRRRRFASHPVCAGPYKFVERVAQDRIVLDRFADYWNKDAVHVDRIVFLPIPDSTVRLANLQSGRLDLIERVGPTDVDTVKKDARLKFADITSLAYTGITINLNNGPRSKNPLGQDARVRQALELSIDRAALNQVVFNGVFRARQPVGVARQSLLHQDRADPGARRRQGKQLLAAANAPHPSFTPDGAEQPGN